MEFGEPKQYLLRLDYEYQICYENDEIKNIGFAKGPTVELHFIFYHCGVLYLSNPYSSRLSALRTYFLYLGEVPDFKSFAFGTFCVAIF